MTAVAPPLTLQANTRIAWSNGNSLGAMNHDEAGTVQRMFGATTTRKPPSRSNSSSSLASTSSSNSTLSAASSASTQSNASSATTTSEAGSWAARKKTGGRALWPPGKAEPATGLSTARPQGVSSASSGPTASSAVSALHAPSMPSQQITNNGSAVQPNGALRNPQPGHGVEPPALLNLLPMNGTFERKTITVPYYPEVLRIGRQTNQKTIPTPLNGYFDSKVLSRQHAEIYANRQGQIFIRDVKSSNGTFVNGMRLSQENKESEPRELREQDVLELGIDIVSEDQKTVVHHKVAAKVEFAGIYGQGQTDKLDFGDLDPSAGPGPLIGQQPLKRGGGQNTLNGRGSLGGQAAMNLGPVNQPPSHMRNWLNPITTEHIVKKLNAEMKLAMQQSQDLARARQAIESMLSGQSVPHASNKTSPEKLRPSPIKSKADMKTLSFFEPPAPPPQAPLPEKPDVARALADPLIQPLLRRSDTARPPSANSSPTRVDHSSDILRLCEELKLAKGELTHQSEKMKNLEHELARERTARESAEVRALQLEKQDTTVFDEGLETSLQQGSNRSSDGASDLQSQLDRLRGSMDEVKQQMEVYRQRAESAEAERDEARRSLAEMVEQKRKDNAMSDALQTPPKSPKSPRRHSRQVDSSSKAKSNGIPVSPVRSDSPTSLTLLEKAGVQEGEPITQEQAKIMTQLLAREILQPDRQKVGNTVMYHGLPAASAVAVVLLGTMVMAWMNGWSKIER